MIVPKPRRIKESPITNDLFSLPQRNVTGSTVKIPPISYEDAI